MPNAGEPIHVVRPVVIPGHFFVIAPLGSAFLSIFPAGFTFIASNALIGGFDPVFTYAIAAFVIAFCICMALFAVKIFGEPSRTSYTFFPDRMEYYEGLLARHHRTVIFDKVIDVELTEGILQRPQGAGTITLVTQQLLSDGEGKLSNRRIAISDVPNPTQVYELVRGLALQTSGSPLENRT